MPRLKAKTKRERAVRTVKILQKHNGNKSAAARELGITRQTLQKKVDQPEVQFTLQKVIDKCLSDANITTEKVYGQLSKQLDAQQTHYDYKKKKEVKRPNWHAQDSARKDALDLLGHRKQKVEHGVDGELAEILKQSDTDKLKGLLSKLK